MECDMRSSVHFIASFRLKLLPPSSREKLLVLRNDKIK